MDIKGVVQKVEKDICEFAEIIEASDEIDEIDEEYSWLIQVRNMPFIGFISCENNNEDINVSTISLALLLYDITNISREKILELFSLNGSFHGCTLSAEKIEDRWKLFLNRRIMVDSYVDGELYDNVLLMFNRYEIFKNEIERIIS